MKAKEIIRKRLVSTARYYRDHEEDYEWQRVTDREFGFMMGVETALNTKGKEFDQISDMWEDFRAASYPCYNSTFENFIKKYEDFIKKYGEAE